METINSAKPNLKHWKIVLFPIAKFEKTYYSYSVIQGKCGFLYKSQQLYSTEYSAYRAAYFLCLRSELNHELQPALILNQKSGYILSINLPAFELLAIDAVGLNFADFTNDSTTYSSMRQQLRLSHKFRQLILLHDADGCLLKCQADAVIEPCISRWIVLRLHPNQ